MSWRDVQTTKREFRLEPGQDPKWECAGCGFSNKPRPLMNSLGRDLPQELLDPNWRISHCEQCGAERP